MMRRPAASGSLRGEMSGRDRHPITEPRIVLLALGAVAVVMLCIVAIAETSDVWLVVLTFVAVASIGAAIAADLGRVIAASADAPAPAAPASGSVVVVSTAAMTAQQVLDAIGPLPAARSIMVVAPEGLGSHGLMVDERDYDRARRAEAETVAALRRAGVNAAGHVGDRDPAHAIADALALFPAADVVVVAHGVEASVYGERLDLADLKRTTGADVRVRELVGS